MQINNAAGIYAAQLNQYQSNTTTSVKSETSPNTLQSDKVTLSAAAMSTAETPELNRGGGLIITGERDPR